MGARPKPKGNKFERKVARLIETDFGPGVKAHRTLQADGAYDSDVTVEGCQLLKSIWWECNDSNKPDPLRKLAQAKLDCDKALLRAHTQRLPIAITHKTGARTIYVTTYNWVWLSLQAGTLLKGAPLGEITLRITWEHFVLVVSEARAKLALQLQGEIIEQIHHGHE